MKSLSPAVTIARGEMAEAFIQKHESVKKIDGMLGWLLIGSLVLQAVYKYGMSVWDFHNGLTAFAVMRVSNDACSLVVALLCFIFWYSLTHYDCRMRWLMTVRTRFTPNGFMRGGFLPIPTAASVGLLLFVTSTFITETVVPGTLVQQSTAGKLLMNCRANGFEEPDYFNVWFSRLHRTSPMPQVSLFTSNVEDTNELEGWCFNAVNDFSKDDVIDATTGKDKVILNLAHPTGDKDGRLCMYQCVTWKVFNLQTILTSTGAIAVGATIVVVMTEWVSTLLGKPVVSKSTSPEDLVKVMGGLRRDSLARRLTKPIQASIFCSAMPIVAVYALLKWCLVTKLDSDGYYTVDYYTMFAILFSVSLVTLLRCWHPFQCRPQLFTKDIWAEGTDNFVIPQRWLDRWNKNYPGKSPEKPEFKKVKDVDGDRGDLVLVKVDLYQWMQLRAQERAELLVNYCRRPSEGDQGRGSLVVSIAAVEVKVLHPTDKTEKIHYLAAGQHLEIVKWKNEEEIIVNADIAGRKEKVLVQRNELLEKSDEWDKALATLGSFGLLKKHVDMCQSSRLEAGGKPLLAPHQI